MDVIHWTGVRYNKRGSFWGIKKGFLSLSLIDPLYYTSTNPVYINGHKRTREREISNHSRTDKPNKNKELIFRRTVEEVGKATTTRRGVSSIALVRRMLSNTKRCSQTHRRHTPVFFSLFHKVEKPQTIVGHPQFPKRRKKNPKKRKFLFKTKRKKNWVNNKPTPEFCVVFKRAR